MCAFLVVIDIPNLKNVSHPESLKGTKKTIMNSILIRSCFMTRCLICSNWSNPGWIKLICGRWFKNRMIVSDQCCLFYYLFWLFAMLPVHFASISYTRGIADLRWINSCLTPFNPILSQIIVIIWFLHYSLEIASRNSYYIIHKWLFLIW